MHRIRLARDAGAQEPELPRWTGAVARGDHPSPVPAPSWSLFRDRRHAGQRLAALLERFRRERPIIVAMPRGGVPVGAEVARSLGASLDVVVVRKIGAPDNPEYAIGAVAEAGVQVSSNAAACSLGLSGDDVTALLRDAEREVSEMARRYRGEREPLALGERTAILVDDGLATGRSARAAIRSLRSRGAAKVILAVPVAAPQSVESLGEEADEVVCVAAPEQLWAVGLWYDDFRPTSDDEVTSLLAESAAQARSAGTAAAGAGAAPAPDTGDGRRAPRFAPDRAHEVAISPRAGLVLGAEVRVPHDARGVVAFAHGSGSSRKSPRNRAVAQTLGGAGYATLLLDLLTPDEERTRANVFDIRLLASRLAAAGEWLAKHGELASLPLAFFGASTGAAAALTAAAELGDRARAVISRGGRPDLALHLGAVQAPTLLIVGGADPQVLELNRQAQRRLRCPKQLAVVAGATHLFEEPGALEQVARLAIDWLDLHLRSASPTSANTARA